ncbi:hypothetical protein C2845_PM04G06310 [Panicum miliaceum]|uniref:Uncharacterized protein n=1 Tax=Panicum miliaceum TaxID=4540 RepID=A0A3L6QRV8_PANMI|nr:hypothetical protein C2845_PM04G06310 [Panicum miliaceum]
MRPSICCKAPIRHKAPSSMGPPRASGPHYLFSPLCFDQFLFLRRLQRGYPSTGGYHSAIPPPAAPEPFAPTSRFARGSICEPQPWPQVVRRLTFRRSRCLEWQRKRWSTGLIFSIGLRRHVSTSALRTGTKKLS